MSMEKKLQMDMNDVKVDDAARMMEYAKEHYYPRLMDAVLEKKLRVFGAVSIEGPKWCGKTWMGYRFARSVASMVDENVRNLALLDPRNVLSGEAPRLIDEWNLVPQLWDAVRFACDFRPTRGNFILTCSMKLSYEEKRRSIRHSGAGRIDRMKISTMSLYETGDSTGEASLSAMRNGEQKLVSASVMLLEDLARFIIRGGWPANLSVEADAYGEIPKSYIEALVENEDETFGVHDAKKLRMLLRSLARNESAVAGDQTLVRDIAEYERSDDALLERHLVDTYLDELGRLNLLADQPAFAVNYRSSARVGKTAKHHFVDPSLAAALLGMTTTEKMMNDLRLFGILFEALVVHDLRVYAEYLGGALYHFRDNMSGDKVDAILEFPDGEYAAIEIKLGFNRYDEAKAALQKFAERAEKKPKFMLVVVGTGMGGVARDRESGIYVASLGALGV